MVTIKESSREELDLFSEMELEAGISPFVIPYSTDEHLETFDKPESRYLSIYDQDHLEGFILLLLEADGFSVEFRRIVVTGKGKGIGQTAIAQVDDYCREVLHRNRIWLDVFENNERARHVYEKSGYKRFKEGDYRGRVLLFYEKTL